MTAQQNISKLPSRCYGVLLSDKSIIQIVAGETGYYPLNKSMEKDLLEKVFKGLTVEQAVNRLNADDNITIQERKAMEWGSMMGWGGRLATADAYDETGNPISEKNTLLA